jgi:hypothetical protein
MASRSESTRPGGRRAKHPTQCAMRRLATPHDITQPISMNHRYHLATFFALAYAISWLLWAPLWLPA